MSALSQACLYIAGRRYALGASCTANQNSQMPNDAPQHVDKKCSLACSGSQPRHHLQVPEIGGEAKACPSCGRGISRSRPGSKQMIDRDNSDSKATDSSFLQSGTPPGVTGVRSRPGTMGRPSTGNGGHMMSEARTPFSMRPCRAAVRQQEAIETGEGLC